MRIKLSVCILLLLLVLLTSCSDILGSQLDSYGGELIDKEKLSSIADSVFSEDESESDGGGDREHNGVYYWTASGDKYHKWRDCEHIRNVSVISSGNITDAIRSGKIELCSDCAKK